MATTRLIAVTDAEEMADLATQNRAFLAPWQPLTPNWAFTVEGQATIIEGVLAGHAKGVALPHVILDRDAIIGRITLSDIVRSAFQSAVLGYWVAEPMNGRGHASAAVAEMCGLAFARLGLHRVQAGTLVHNAASQRVLTRNGFHRFGLAPRYLSIAGEWQDHVLFQRLNEPEDVSGDGAA